MSVKNGPEKLWEWILESGTEIQGPEEIEYGYGWAPTLTYWKGKRRVYLYFDLTTKNSGEVMEVADRVSLRALRRAYGEIQEVWEVMRAFLIEEVAIDELPGVWVEDTMDHDKFIPDPPNQDRPGDIAQLAKRLKFED